MTGFDPAAFRAGLRRESYRRPGTRSTAMTGSRLTDRDREIIEQARSLRNTPLMDGLRERTGNTDVVSAFVAGWGEAMNLLAEYDAIVTRMDEDGSEEER